MSIPMFALRGALWLALAALVSGCGTFRQTAKETFADTRAYHFPQEAPVARLSPKFSTARVGETVVFDASESVGGEGALRYRWFVMERPAGSAASAAGAEGPKWSLPIDRPGRYRVRLVVSDERFDGLPFDAVVDTDAKALPWVRFVAIGDQGTGSPAQHRVGEAIGEVCRARGCDFVLGLGDNFYPGGPDGISDPRFITHFEEPYRSVGAPFFMVLGNHDNGIRDGDGGFNARGEIEVRYGSAAGRTSDKWHSPARYYRFTTPLPGDRDEEQTEREWLQANAQPLAEFFAVDTTPLTSAPDLVPRYNLKFYERKEGAWLAAGLNNSKAQWRIALGHHPYRSNGRHGDAGNYDRISDIKESFAEHTPILDKVVLRRAAGEHFKAFFDEHLCGRVDLYLSGHDHDLQWLKPIEACGATHFFVSGAGAKTTALRGEGAANGFNDAYWQADEPGFFRFEIDGPRMRVEAYTVDPDTGEYRLAHQGEIVK